MATRRMRPCLGPPICRSQSVISGGGGRHRWARAFLTHGTVGRATFSFPSPPPPPQGGEGEWFAAFPPWGGWSVANPVGGKHSLAVAFIAPPRGMAGGG